MKRPMVNLVHLEYFSRISISHLDAACVCVVLLLRYGKYLHENGSEQDTGAYQTQANHTGPFANAPLGYSNTLHHEI